MPFTNQKIFEVITPVSESDSAYEDHEFLLCWFGRNGAFYQYLFTDWVNSVSVSTSVINVQDQDTIESNINSEDRKVTLYAEDLSKNDLEVIGGLMAQKKAIRLYKDSTFERIGIDSNSYSYRQSGGRYNIQFDIILYEKPLPK